MYYTDKENVNYKYISLILFVSPIFSLNQNLNTDLYEPGIFNPLSNVLINGVKDFSSRPYMIIAYDNKNQILEKSLIHYTKEGKIQSETILDGNNKLKGTIQYHYDDKGNIIREEYFDNQNQNLATKKRFFDSKNQVIKIEFYDRNQIAFIRQYQYDKNQIKGIEQAGNLKDYFLIKLHQNRIQEIEFYLENKQVRTRIIHIYNENRKIKERIKFNGESKSICEYEYDSQNRIKRFTFSDMIRNKRVVYKTVELVYADQL